MQRLHTVEAELGRERAERWGPRICDLDLLGLGEAVLPGMDEVRKWMAMQDDQASTPPDGLILPHPRLHRRAFVLLPLLDVAPDWQHPVLGRTVDQMVAALTPPDLAGIEIL